ncbi:hypothetical protein E2320_000818 [Naja naja]|nr:hypothetical protein E2320_000818 [Naja naja]
MWDQIGWVCSEEMQAKSNNFKQNCDGRRKRNNYTNTLKELAQMLPIPLRTSCKRLTKKEILLRVLRYIEHLQTSIDRARSLLQGCGEEQKAAGSQPVVIPALKRERREVTPRAKNPKPLAVYKKPRKRRRTRRSDRRGGMNRKVCKYLALEAGKDSTHAVPHLEEESLPDVGDVSSILSSFQKQSTSFPNFKVPLPEPNQPANTNLLDLTKIGVPFDPAGWNFDGDQEYKDENTFSVCTAQRAYNKLHQYSGGPGHTLLRQELVHYHSSCEEEEEEEPKASPWLSIQSPLKFSSVLFEDAYLSPQCNSFSHTPAGTLLRKSAFTLDHCYLSYSEAGKTESSPMSRVNEILSSWSEQIQEVKRAFPETAGILFLPGQVLCYDRGSSWTSAAIVPASFCAFLFQEPPPVRAEGPGSSSEENSDSTWTPSFPRAKVLPGGPARKKSRKKQKQKKKVAGAGRRARRPSAGAEKRSNASSPPLQLKKKCVNGFIMFCRLNRKHFIRTCPGMASTAATKELAQLWRMMTKQERKPYCMKARRFSRLNNRIVRDDFSSGDEEPEAPKPFHLLLAEKAIPGTQTVGNVSLLGCIP